LTLPLVAALVTAWDTLRRPRSPFESFGVGAATGAAYFAIALFTGLIHGFRVGFCEPVGGVILLALGPGSGTVLGGVWGVFAAFAVLSLPGRRWHRASLALALAAAGPLAGDLMSLWRFYTSPMAFAFDPFFGHLAGPLYDTILPSDYALRTYRVGTSCTLLALGVFAFHLTRDDDGRVRLCWRSKPGWAALGALAATASLWHSAAGASLGHYATSASIEEALGGRLAARRCELVYSTALPRRDVELLARECDGFVSELERYLETRGPNTIRVYVFQNADEKKRRIGAGSTQIAKPWRDEVYVHGAAYPHHVLGHELAHVIAGKFARGPFRVAGGFAGFLPDPGLIEGLAVAAAPPDDELLPEEWARVMLELGLLPPLEKVFELSFLGVQAQTAYTVAGAFIDWFRSRFGADALKRWYGGAPLAELTQGHSLAELEKQWRSVLAEERADRRALATARLRFDRPSVFGRRCPHAVDRLEAEAYGLLGAGDPDAARERFERLLKLDATHFSARVGVATCALRRGELGDAERIYAALSRDAALTELNRVYAVEASADLSMMRGRFPEAASGYERVREAVVDEDRLRALDVKVRAAELGETPAERLGRKGIVELLVGDPKQGPSWDVAATLLAGWSATDVDQGLSEYLLGKNLFGRGLWSAARERLDSALARGLELPRVRVEALSDRLKLACAERRTGTAKRMLEALRAERLRAARRHAIEAVALRCGVGSAPSP
jgi:tetratricopeptide (TPR) repeat protein